MIVPHKQDKQEVGEVPKRTKQQVPTTFIPKDCCGRKGFGALYMEEGRGRAGVALSMSVDKSISLLLLPTQ